jgi:hypothetical protein
MVRMNAKNKRKSSDEKPKNGPKTGELGMIKEAALAYEVDEQPMVRTQIYLSKPEHEFIQHEASRQGQPMAAVIRAFIDEKMDVPEEVWTDNPLLHPPVEDPAWTGPDDGAINHDHYIYGTPKKWMQRDGQWVETPPLPDDYYSNPQSRRAYDDEVNRRT